MVAPALQAGGRRFDPGWLHTYIWLCSAGFGRAGSRSAGHLDPASRDLCPFVPIRQSRRSRRDRGWPSSVALATSRDDTAPSRCRGSENPTSGSPLCQRRVQPCIPQAHGFHRHERGATGRTLIKFPGAVTQSLQESLRPRSTALPTARPHLPLDRHSCGLSENSCTRLATPDAASSHLDLAPPSLRSLRPGGTWPYTHNPRTRVSGQTLFDRWPLMHSYRDSEIVATPTLLGTFVWKSAR